jgi:hypothetical protein
MAQIAKATYYNIANDYAAIWSYLDGVAAQAQAGLYEVLDVTTGTYQPTAASGAAGAVSATAALEIELALLNTYNSAYNAVKNIASSSSSLMDAVRAINNHVINNYPSSTDAPNGYGGVRATTPDTKLADFVRFVAFAGATSHDHYCIPEGWYELCVQAGYDCDVAGWVWDVCS